MKYLLASLLLASACGGPGQNALANTPTATTKATPATAPAASDSDAEREHLMRTHDDMRDAQQAHREAATGSASPEPATPGPTDSGTTTVQPKTRPASPDKPPPPGNK